MKEHPILFSTDMVKGILEGRKTQTRRVIVPQPWGMDACYFKDFRKDYGGRVCPYGQVGDRLWVRETWALIKLLDDIKPSEIQWCNRVPIWYKDKPHYEQHPINPWPEGNIGKWQPSIFMPRWASRITLEITGLRVERVQEITPIDAVGEGCPTYHEYNDKWECIKTISNVDRFRLLWDFINAKRGYSWEGNPWVWVVEFKIL